jgi:hypothetical protein
MVYKQVWIIIQDDSGKYALNKDEDGHAAEEAPPSTDIVWAVMNFDSGEARYETMLARSSGRPSLFRGEIFSLTEKSSVPSGLRGVASLTEAIMSLRNCYDRKR